MNRESTNDAPRRGRRFGLWATGALALLASCSNTTRIPPRPPQPTSLAVSPKDFLGSTACGGAPGNLLVYQATLYDVTEDLDSPFELPSSELLTCDRDAYFERIVAEHRYIARIRAYDRTDLAPLSLGSPVALDPAGLPVTPRFTTTCLGNDGVDYSLGGAPNGDLGLDGVGGASSVEGWGVQAFENARIYVRGCLPLVDAAPGARTTVRVGIETALGGVRCGDGPQDLARFTIDGVLAEPSAEDEGLGGAGGAGGGGAGGGGAGGGDPALRSFACTENYLDEVEGSAEVRYRLLGWSSGASEPTWEAFCFATPSPGFEVDVECDPLRPL